MAPEARLLEEDVIRARDLAELGHGEALLLEVPKKYLSYPFSLGESSVFGSCSTSTLILLPTPRVLQYSHGPNLWRPSPSRHSAAVVTALVQLFFASNYFDLGALLWNSMLECSCGGCSLPRSKTKVSKSGGLTISKKMGARCLWRDEREPWELPRVSLPTWLLILASLNSSTTF